MPSRCIDDAAQFRARFSVLLPPKPGRLIEEQIRHPARISMLEQLPGDGSRYIWPGRPASRPIGGGWAHTRLKWHALPSLSARNTAMIDFVAELPPIVVSDLLASTRARRTSGLASRRTAGRTTLPPARKTETDSPGALGGPTASGLPQISIRRCHQCRVSGAKGSLTVRLRTRASTGSSAARSSRRARVRRFHAATSSSVRICPVGTSEYP